MGFKLNNYPANMDKNKFNNRVQLLHLLSICAFKQDIFYKSQACTTITVGYHKITPPKMNLN
jgi:hypothetical protein